MEVKMTFLWDNDRNFCVSARMNNKVESLHSSPSARVSGQNAYCEHSLKRDRIGRRDESQSRLLQNIWAAKNRQT